MNAAMSNEHASRTFAASCAVPEVVADDRPNELTVSFVPGDHGQDLLDRGHGKWVLGLCGSLLRTLERIGDDLPPEIPGRGPQLVHGDFGPQNILFDLEQEEVAAVLDWEFAHRGEVIEDVAWCEWIVRMHHGDRQADLVHLFDGFGRCPPWHLRHAQMLRRCEELLHFADRQGWTDAAEMWRARVTATEGWTE